MRGSVSTDEDMQRWSCCQHSRYSRDSTLLACRGVVRRNLLHACAVEDRLLKYLLKRFLKDCLMRRIITVLIAVDGLDQHFVDKC